MARVADQPLGITLYALAAKRFSGLFELNHGSRQCNLGFSAGKLVFALSPEQSDHPARIALKAGLINTSHVQALLARGTSMDPISDLAEIAKLDENQSEQLRRRHGAVAATRVFAYPEASYELTGEAPQGEALVSIHWVIHTGVRTHYSDQRLLHELSLLNGRTIKLSRQAAPFLASFGFDVEQLKVIDTLKSEAMEVRELANRLQGLDRRRLLSAVYALFTTSCLELDGEQVAAAPPRETAPEAAAEPEAPAEPEAATAPEPPAEPEAATAPEHEPALQHETPPASTSEVTTEETPIRKQRREQAGERERAETVASKAVEPADAAEPESEAEPSSEPDGHNKVRLRRAAARATDVRALVEDRLKVLENGADHYQLLGVAQGCASGELRKAYFELARNLHPDRVRAAGAEIADQASQNLFAKINVAFGVLSNPQKRSKYNEVLSAGGEAAYRRQQEEAENKAIAILTAEEHFQIGDMALRRNAFKKAYEEFKTAVTLNPDEGEHHAYFGWATWCIADDKSSVASEVNKILDRSIEMSPKSPPAYFFKAQIAKQRNKTNEAVRLFEKVLSLNPQHREAKQELRLLRSRGA